MKLKQLAISIENAPGRIYEVTSALGNEGINLRALNLVDTGLWGQLRLLVSDIAKARQILMEMQVPAQVNEVVATEIEDKPGSLAAVLKFLNDARVTPLYMYTYLGVSVGKAVLISRFTDNDKAVEVLQKNGVRLLDAEAFGIMESGGNGA